MTIIALVTRPVRRWDGVFYVQSAAFKPADLGVDKHTNVNDPENRAPSHTHTRARAHTWLVKQCLVIGILYWFLLSNNNNNDKKYKCRSDKKTIYQHGTKYRSFIQGVSHFKFKSQVKILNLILDKKNQ